MNEKSFKLIKNITTAIFLLVIFVFFYTKVNPELIHYKQQPLFLFDKFFLYGFLKYQGGVSEYIALFFTQFFTYKFAGSLLITLLIFVIALLTGSVLNSFYGKTSNTVLHYIPSLLFALLFTHYSFQLTALIVFGLSLLFGLLYLKTQKSSPVIKTATLLIIMPLLFYLAGGSGLILFSTIVLVSEISYLKKTNSIINIALVLLLLVGITLLTSLFSAYTGFKTALLGLLHNAAQQKTMLWLLWASVPVFAALQPVIKQTGKIPFISKNMRVITGANMLVILLFAVSLLPFQNNKKEKNSVLVDFYAAQGEWDKVPETAQNLSFSDRSVIFQVNRALYHQGRLAGEAFSYPQHWGEYGLILTTYYNSKVLMKCSDLFFEMGHVKGALHWAYEAQTKKENSPEVLKRIILCNILTGEYTTAEKFLAVLSKSPVHRNWAKKYRAYLNNPKKITNDKKLNSIYRFIPSNDFFSNTRHPQYDLLKLLEENPDNKMAFEYFMIDCLLTHNLAQLALNLKYLDNLGYTSIPRHIEEGLLLFMVLNENFRPDLGKFKISAESQQRFSDYSKILMKYRGNRKEAQNEIAEKYSDTFWYYINYLSPITLKRKINEN
ncbi:MAG: DUF6057 family protein [Prolixibacteraceae bacterium]|nr:DUF6057 family protein [Prolixibacteraceae bacterium]